MMWSRASPWHPHPPKRLEYCPVASHTGTHIVQRVNWRLGGGVLGINTGLFLFQTGWNVCVDSHVEYERSAWICFTHWWEVVSATKAGNVGIKTWVPEHRRVQLEYSHDVLTLHTKSERHFPCPWQKPSLAKPCSTLQGNKPVHGP